MEITKVEDVFHLIGRVDEFADFSVLELASEPLKVNLAKVSSMNSVGIRKLLGFAIRWSPKKLEVFECTSDFIETLNVIPELVGVSNSGASPVKSFYVPFSCVSCTLVQSELFEVGKIIDAGVEFILNAKPACKQCSGQLALDVDPDEYLAFLQR